MINTTIIAINSIIFQICLDLLCESSADFVGYANSHPKFKNLYHYLGIYKVIYLYDIFSHGRFYHYDEKTP